MRDLEEVKRRLQAGIGAGEVFGICYHGGSKPGAYREVIPLQIVGDKVRAKCRMSNAAKTFNLDKIELCGERPGPGSTRVTWDPEAPAIIAVAGTIAEIAGLHRAALESLGWHVTAESTEDGDYLCLYRRTRAGKLLKHPTVALCFEPLTWDITALANGDTVRSNHRQRVRPWGVRGTGGRSLGTWSTPAKAVETLMREAAPPVRTQPTQPAPHAD